MICFWWDPMIIDPPQKKRWIYRFCCRIFILNKLVELPTPWKKKKKPTNLHQMQTLMEYYSAFQSYEKDLRKFLSADTKIICCHVYIHWLMNSNVEVILFTQ